SAGECRSSYHYAQGGRVCGDRSDQSVYRVYVPVLSKTQRNDILKMVANAGLNPLDFELTEGRQPSRGHVETFRHRATECWIDFSFADEGDFWAQWWPRFDTGGDHAFFQPWSGGYDVIHEWAREVKRIHEAPDLWAEARKARVLSDAAGHVDDDNTPFDV